MDGLLKLLNLSGHLVQQHIGRLEQHAAESAARIAELESFLGTERCGYCGYPHVVGVDCQCDGARDARAEEKS